MTDDNKPEIKSITVDKLKNGFLISPNTRQAQSYDSCVFIEGHSPARLAKEILIMFDIESELESGDL